MPELLYLSRQDVEAVAPPMAQVIELVALALREKAANRVQMPPKPTLHPAPGALLQAMPAWVGAVGAMGVKWVAAFADNSKRNLPAVSGLIIVANSETGFPEAVMDAAWVTGARTGAATAVAARALADCHSEVLAVLGAGVQARSNVAALRQVLPRLRLVRVFAPRHETATRFRHDIAVEHGPEVEIASCPEQAIRDANVVVTATPWPRVSGSPELQPGWFQPGVFACALDLDSSFPARAVAAFDTRFCDDLATLQLSREKGRFSAWPEAQELAPAVAGGELCRRTAAERIFVLILGLGIYDLVVARHVVDAARRRGIGRVLPL